MAYFQITLKVPDEKRPAILKLFHDFKAPFLKNIKGARGKYLLIRDEDVQILHDFDSILDAQAYFKSEMFNNDVARELLPCFDGPPEIRIYDSFESNSFQFFLFYEKDFRFYEKEDAL